PVRISSVELDSQYNRSTWWCACSIIECRAPNDYRSKATCSFTAAPVGRGNESPLPLLRENERRQRDDGRKQDHKTGPSHASSECKFYSTCVSRDNRRFVHFAYSIFRIVIIDLVLSGDNAVVIGMPAHR